MNLRGTRNKPQAKSSMARPSGPPPRHKLAVVTWIGAYAAITAILQLLGPTMATWALPLRTLLISVIMVIALTWVVLPVLHRAFRPWLTG